MQAQSSQDIQGFQGTRLEGRQVSRPMGMFHLPSNSELLDPFWDLPQRLLKDWGRTSLFFAHLSLHPHPKHAISRLTAATYPAGARAKSPPLHIPPAEFDESWQRRTVHSIL